MKKCKTCGKNHQDDHEHFRSKIPEKGFPTSSKDYQRAHAIASKKEKEKYPKGYEKLKSIDRSAGQKHQLIGKSTKSGKLEVSKQVPRSLRKEVKYHEKIESKELRKKKK